MANPILDNGQGANQSIYEISTVEKHTYGQRARFEDGRVFYYTRHMGSSALAIGELHVAPQLVANHQNMATATNVLAVGVLDIGDITLGATAATANQYRFGYLAVTDGGGQAQYFRIRSHSAVASAGVMSDLVVFDAPHTASDAGTTVSLHTSLYDTPQQSNTDQADVLVGVPVITIPAGNTTAQFGWLQTWGPCPVLFDEAVSGIGSALVPGTSTAGSVEEDDTATTVSQEPIVGYNIAAGVDTEFQLVDLRIRP